MGACRAPAPGGLRLRAAGPARHVVAARLRAGLRRRRPPRRRWPSSTTSWPACAPRRTGASRARSAGASRARRSPDAARPLLDDPERGLAELTRMMAGYFERAIAPWWPEIRAALEDDILHRARRLTAGGAIEVFEDLHHQVHWRDGVLEVDRPYEQQVDLGGRGLLLVPAAFAWPRVFAMFDEPWQPALIYTPRGLGSLWAPAGRRRRRRGARGPARPPPRGDPRGAGHAGGDERPGAAPRRLGGRRQRAPGRPAARRAGARGARRAARPLLAHAQRRSCAALSLSARGLEPPTAQSPSTSARRGAHPCAPQRRP